MAQKEFRFFNVGNGQSVLVTLDTKTHLLFDLLQKPVDAGKDDKRVDVHAELLGILPLRGDDPYISVACFSHADRDHCQGFARVFRCGDSPKDAENLITIDELWVTACLFRLQKSELDDSAVALQKEARRRLKLWTDASKRSEAEKAGNRLVVFGNTVDDPDLEKLPTSQRYTAGKAITSVAGAERSDFEMFVHSPFRKVIEDPSIEPNDGSLIGQVAVKGGRQTSLLLIGGDARCGIWRQVYNQTKRHGRLEKLDSDMFFCPHHGSYEFFTEKCGKEGRREASERPADTSMKILNQIRARGWLICSSRPTNGSYDDDCPPHEEALKHYRKRAADIDGTFSCLMEQPSKAAPRPLILRLTDAGLQRQDGDAATAAATVSVAAAATPSRWGA